jgi:hypothetical protein
MRQFYETINHSPFIILASFWASSTMACLPDFINGMVRTTHNKTLSLKFLRPDGTLESVPVHWLTNQPVGFKPLHFFEKRELRYTDRIDAGRFELYNLKSVTDIPAYTDKLLTVPITVLSFNQNQYRILTKLYLWNYRQNKTMFVRILIQHTSQPALPDTDIATIFQITDSDVSRNRRRKRKIRQAENVSICQKSDSLIN